jgi:heptosyltransferase-3
MAEVIRRAALFVGIDSGPAHVANAVGTPGVILLGAYRDFGRYMPYSGAYQTGANATLVHEPSALQNLPTAPVLAAIRSRLQQQRVGAGAEIG